MANLIIKPTSGGSLILQDEGGTAAHTIDANGKSTFANLQGPLKTPTNAYDFVKGGELNSLGYLNHNFFGCSYYLSSSKSIAHTTWTEVDGTWTVLATSGSSGSDNADLFGKFSGGRFTPTVSGYYQVNASLYMPDMDDSEVVYMAVRRNGADDTAMICFGNLRGTATNVDLGMSGAGIIGLDTNDYISLWAYQNEGGTNNIAVNQTKLSVTYIGTSDL